MTGLINSKDVKKGIVDVLKKEAEKHNVSLNDIYGCFIVREEKLRFKKKTAHKVRVLIGSWSKSFTHEIHKLKSLSKVELMSGGAVCKSVKGIFDAYEMSDKIPFYEFKLLCYVPKGEQLEVQIRRGGKMLGNVYDEDFTLEEVFDAPVEGDKTKEDFAKEIQESDIPEEEKERLLKKL